MKSMKIAGKLKKHYRSFPVNPNDFPIWKKQCDVLWTKAGSMADKIENNN
jgi:hypothetical protein